MSLRDDAGASAWGTSAASKQGEPMLLRSIRSQLLGLVVATVVPFTALIGTGLWSQWRTDQAAAIQRACDEARLIVAQVDDHIGNLTNLLIGLSQAVSTYPADVAANDAMLRRVKADLPAFVGNIAVFSLDGFNIGTSSQAAADTSARYLPDSVWQSA